MIAVVAFSCPGASHPNLATCLDGAAKRGYKNEAGSTGTACRAQSVAAFVKDVLCGIAV
jgi:hypothetical protein